MNPQPRPLWEIYLWTTPRAEETATTLLEQTLAKPVSTVTNLRTGRVRVSGYLPQPPAEGWAALHRAFRQERDALPHTIATANLGPLRTRRLPARRWAQAWKAHFRPFAVGNALLIRPSWSRRRPQHGMRLITMDPGLSFGTGLHPTTRFCLDQLLARRRPDQPQSCLDLGTGSGLLAIAAAKLGYDRIEALDFDPVAVEIARRNLRRNRVPASVSVRQDDVRTLPLRPAVRHDVVCANLQADLLIRERKRIANSVQPRGFLILAGILRQEMATVAKAYQGVGFRLLRSRSQGEWRSGCLRRSGSVAG